MPQPTILLVDDDESILALYRLALRRKPDWVLCSALDGERALQLAVECNPDFVVLDVMLPDIDGIEICRRLRLQTSMMHVPVVMLSAHTDPAIQRAAQTAGANEYWVKPISPADFVNRIDRWLYGPLVA
jgi:DNA-binding response OmpR family regulator